MKFTKEEISLCKQIAEKYRFEKLVKEGDWIQQNYGTPCIDLVTSEYIRNILRFTDVKHWFPLWTISDCLEFLREKGWFARDLIEDGGEVGVTFLHHTVKEEKFSTGDGKTPLEACLKAVLAMIEKKK